MRRVKRPLFTLLQLALGSILLLISLHFGSRGALCQGSPNVVVILADDMGWTDWQQDATLNPTGSVVYETPNLLRLAQQGVTFNQAYAAAPLCTPTRSALLTGKAPARSKLTQIVPAAFPGYSTPNLREPDNWTKGILQADITMAESLRTAGYATGYFGKWHLGTQVNSVNPLDHGFDVNIGGNGQGSPEQAGGFFAGTDGAWAGMPGLQTPGQFPSDKFLSDAIDDEAVNYISQRVANGTPFYLQMSEYPVHVPIQAPADLVAKYQTKINNLQGMGVDMQGHTNATYAALTEKLDQSVGRLLDRLDDPNNDGNTSDSVRNNTIVIFTADNGGVWAPGSQEGAITRNLPLREGKGSVYEGGIREPMIMSWTGNANMVQATVSDARSSTYDLYPTILDLTGYLNNPAVPKNPNMDGVSIKAAIEGQAFDRGLLYWHFPHVSNQDQASTSITAGSFVSAVSNDQWKLIFFYEDRHYELYNLDADIDESSNVLGQNPVVAYELSKALNNYLANVGALMPVSKSTNLAVALPTILLLGDYDHNGIVAANDFQIWKDNFGATIAPGTGADGTGDGLVTTADYTVWRDHLGQSAGAGGGSGSSLIAGAVPEPGTATLAAVGLSCSCVVLRQRRLCRPMRFLRCPVRHVRRVCGPQRS